MSVPRSLAALALGLAAGLALVACTPDRLTTPTTAAGLTPAPASADRSPGGSDDPHFLQPETGAPTIANPVVQFWAKKGEDRIASMYYHRAHGGRDSIPFFTLRVRPRSLYRRPNGTAFANGDSVLITLTLVDAQQLIVDCQPAGLLFTPSDPARLKMSFAETDDDVNHDGTVNAVDAALTHTFAVWRRETPTDPWIRMASNVATGAHEVETDVGGFTGYAIAW
ncbi:MAG: hypothetical protein JO180_10420 [Gemmatirosa sp.]|nr:hypothetical protein [Gemmatirosa sp.]